MKASPAAINLIKRFESLRLEAYLCPAGVRTIGWGHTEGVQPGQRITVETRKLWQQDIDQVEKDLARTIAVPLTQGQYDALVSFVLQPEGRRAAASAHCSRSWSKS